MIVSKWSLLQRFMVNLGWDVPAFGSLLLYCPGCCTLCKYKFPLVGGIGIILSSVTFSIASETFLLEWKFTISSSYCRGELQFLHLFLKIIHFLEYHNHDLHSTWELLPFYLLSSGPVFKLPKIGWSRISLEKGVCLSWRSS